MDRAAILRIIRHIPEQIDNTLIPESWTSSSLALKSRNRWITNPAVGYSIVDYFIKARKSLPYAAKEYDWISRAYNRERHGGYDEPIVDAITVELSENKRISSCWKAMLLAKDFSFEEMARILNTPLDTIYAYEQLFFNVVDRRADALYMAGIPYPEGIAPELAPDYYTTEDIGMIAQRASFKHNMQDGLIMFGLGSLARKAGDAGNLEDDIMAHGSYFARNGGLMRGHPAISRASGLLAAAKQGGKDSSTSSLDKGGPTSMQDSLLKGLLAFHSADAAKKKRPTLPGPSV